MITNKQGCYTATMLAAHRLFPLLGWVVSGDTLLTKKPDLAVIKSCIQAFGLPPHRMLFVGESSIGVATARNAGINVGALPYGYNKRPADRGQRPRPSDCYLLFAIELIAARAHADCARSTFCS